MCLCLLFFVLFLFFFFKQKTAYEFRLSRVGSEMCIRDKAPADAGFAFEKIGDLWNEEITAELHSDDEAEIESLEDSELDRDDDMKTDETESKQTRKRLRRDQLDDTKERRNEQSRTTTPK